MVEDQEEEIIHNLTSEEKLAAWGYGEWVEEPEEIKFTYKGFRCLIHRVFFNHGSIIELGHFCGYLSFPKVIPGSASTMMILNAKFTEV